MKIIEEVGNIHRGGFGIIDKVKCENGLYYARKTFSPRNRESYEVETINGLRKRFIREVSVQQELPENLFIPILHSDLSGKNPWFIMPIADSVFTEEIKNCLLQGRNPDGLADILNALEHLHDLGFVHRDLKPANILFHEDRWKLADLGLITPKEDLTSSLTNTDDWAGTAFYCAPEQLKDFKNVTHHADIYSFGAILHDIFNGNGRIPYQKLTAEGTVGFIIEKCTETLIHKRFKNVKSLRSSLLTVLSKETVQKPIVEATEEWATKLKTDFAWNIEELEKLFFYLKKNPEERPTIFWEITENNLKKFFDTDLEYFKSISLMYLDWIENTNFRFNYCDVLADKIWFIYQISDDLELLAEAALKSSRLGASHNRWYVMEYVVKMCNNSISEMLANRISIEIKIGGNSVKRNFQLCTERIRRPLKAYHPNIVEVLL